MTILKIKTKARLQNARRAYLVASAAILTVVQAMTVGGYTTFRFTLLPLMFCTPILLVFAVAIPYICFKNLEKQSLVERLRNTD